jgi:hypothetical protein
MGSAEGLNGPSAAASRSFSVGRQRFGSDIAEMLQIRKLRGKTITVYTVYQNLFMPLLLEKKGSKMHTGTSFRRISAYRHF